MTVEEMHREAAQIVDEPRWLMVAELCERLDAQNALLERIALAMEGQIKP